MITRVVTTMLAVTVLASCKLSSRNEQNEQQKQKSNMSTGYQRVDWRHTTNIYEVNLRQYSGQGTIKAFMPEMKRLKEMGVETLWFMPLTPIAQKGKKGSMGSYYACSDYTAVAEEFGSVQDFKELVNEAHKLGMKVIIDWVANHTGWDHVWTKSHPDYYLKDSATNDFKIASGMDDIIELDYKNPALRKAMIEAMQFWIKECDIDGFRADLAFWVELDFWKEARTACDAVKPLYWLAENDMLDHPEYAEVFDASYTWTWMHKAKDFYQKQLPLTALDSVLQRYDSVPKDGINAWFTTNHDENSWNGTEYEKYGDMAKALAVFSATWPGTPLIYSGQELPNKKRLQFFEKDPIEWTGKNELHDFYKTLLTLHSTHLALRAGDAAAQTFRLQTDANDKVFAFLRKNGDKEVLVVLNLSKQGDLHFELTDPRVSGKFKNAFSGAENDFSAGKAFEMQPWEYLVYVK